MFVLVCTSAGSFYTVSLYVFKQFAGLSGFPGLGVAQGLSNPLPFGQNLHPTGAFQPKVVPLLLCFFHSFIIIIIIIIRAVND